MKNQALKDSYANIPKQIKQSNDQQDLEMVDEQARQDEDLENFNEVEVEGIFIKHDFDHIILGDDEVEKFTNGQLTYSTMKQTIFIPY